MGKKISLVKGNAYFIGTDCYIFIGSTRDFEGFNQAFSKQGYLISVTDFCKLNIDALNIGDFQYLLFLKFSYEFKFFNYKRILRNLSLDDLSNEIVVMSDRDFNFTELCTLPKNFGNYFTDLHKNILLRNKLAGVELIE